MRIRFKTASLLWLFAHFVLILVGWICWLQGDLPSHANSKAIWQAVGSSLIASGLAGEVLFLYVWFSDETRQRLEVFVQAGLVNVFPFRSMQIKAEYDRRISKAKEIDIIGFGLSSLREDYSNRFSEWSRKSKVRILLLDPDFPSKKISYSSQRDIEEGHHKGKIAQDVKAFLEAVRGSEGLVYARFQIRLLRALPSINMFRVDDEAFWGPYFALQQSRNTPTMLVSGGFLLDRLREHFDSLWNSDEFSAPAFPEIPEQK